MKAAVIGLALSVCGMIVTGTKLQLEQLKPAVESSYGKPVVLYKAKSLGQHKGKHRYDAKERQDVAHAVADAGYVDYVATLEKELWK